MDPIVKGSKHSGGDPEIFDPNGDVILVDEAETTPVRMRVHSKYLSSVSEVFATMFNSLSVEGQGLSEEFPKEVTLSDHVPYHLCTAMRTMICVLYHHNDALPDVLDATRLLDLAELAGKYSLERALKFAAEHWLQHLPDEEQWVNHVYAMAAAWYFKNPKIFLAYTTAAMLNWNQDFKAIDVRRDFRSSAHFYGGLFST